MTNSRTPRISTFITGMMLALPAIAQDALSNAINDDYPALESLYHHLHANPELSFQEANTAPRLPP